jgi:hypothetical protein
VKESVDLSKLADLPEEYISHFSNKTILKDRTELAQMHMDQKIALSQQENKRELCRLQKECLLNCDIDEGAKMIAREREKIKKLAAEMKPTLEEENKFRDELQHELRNNAVFKQDAQIHHIEEKYQKRLVQIEKKIKERKEHRDEQLR